jgi:hypothetical protein
MIGAFLATRRYAFQALQPEGVPLRTFAQSDSIAMTTPAPPLTNLQLELLKVFSRPVADEDLLAIRQLISAYFARKATELADAARDEQGLSEATTDTWRQNHLRTPYKPSLVAAPLIQKNNE